MYANETARGGKNQSTGRGGGGGPHGIRLGNFVLKKKR